MSHFLWSGGDGTSPPIEEVGPRLFSIQHSMASRGLAPAFSQRRPSILNQEKWDAPCKIRVIFAAGTVKRLWAKNLDGETTMNWKLVAGLACGMALLLGACSSNNASGTTTGGSNDNGGTDGGGGDGGDGGMGGDDNTDGAITAAQQTALNAADRAYQAALDAVKAATDAAAEAVTRDTPAARTEAAEKIAEARAALTAAVNAADEAVEATKDGSDTAVGLAIQKQSLANDYKTAQETALTDAVGSYAWYRTDLVRRTMSNGEVVRPRDGANMVTVIRTPRTKDNADNTAQIANTGDNVIKADMFETIMYSANKEVFSVSGDEFKVEGYVAHLTAYPAFDTSLQTGLKITNSGIEIRTGGVRARPGTWGEGEFDSDYFDMRKKVNQRTAAGVNSAPAIGDQHNAWDLKISFDEPLSTTSLGGESNWFGNGDFYWRGIVKADPRQLDSAETDYYVANTFTQAAGRKDLGLYEVWLSNHAGVNRRLEPTADSGPVTCPGGMPSSETGNACPDDDVNQYLDYAAYGLFLYSPDSEVLGTADSVNPDDSSAGSDREIYKVRRGRVQSMYFGYSAFADKADQRTKDIGTAVTGATFRGQSLARAYTGGATSPTPALARNRFLRADVRLTVNIGKGTSGSTNIKGEVSNFEEWYQADGRWVAYPSGFKAFWNTDGTEGGAAVAIAPAGTFNGVSKFAAVAGTDPDGTGGLPALDPTRAGSARTAANGYLRNDGLGIFKGSFYGPGPGTDGSNLEIAGSWSVGDITATAQSPGHVQDGYKIVGSFGAKQWSEE